MELIKTLLLISSIAFVSAVPCRGGVGGSGSIPTDVSGQYRGKRSPQMPPMPPMPPGVPPPPGMGLSPDQAESLVRIARQADSPPPPSSKRVERQAPPPPPGPPSKRVAREAMEAEAEKPKHFRQESLYSSVTTLSRKK